MSDDDRLPEDDKSRAPDYTSRTCWIDVENNTGQTLDCVIMGYQGGAGSQSMIWNKVGTGPRNSPIRIDYRTGDLSSDSWYVSYAWGNYVYQTDIHICDLYSEDDGGTGYIRFNGLQDVEIVPPVSSNCSFNVDCVNS